MSSGTFKAGFTSPVSISQFYSQPPDTPGNVGICLSGGGSRALTAGMGQLRALASLTTPDNKSLLSQAIAVSTVSGGSWLGVPYEFLPAAATTDCNYLGSDFDPATVTLDQLQQLPEGNAGLPLTSSLFSPVGLGLSAFVLWKYCGVQANMLWQTVIALDVLSNYGLYSLTGTNLAPDDTFSYNQATLQDDVTTPNPSLATETAYLFADQVSSSRGRRPFLICNMGMFVTEPGTSVSFLAPVQASPFLTGILGSPAGTDGNGEPVGGGAVTSFGFNSVLQSAQNGVATINQLRQWSITDIVGTSSAFFAEMLKNLFQTWEQDAVKFAQDLGEYIDDLWKWIEQHLPFEHQAKATAGLRQLVSLVKSEEPNAALSAMDWPDLDAIIPAYYYWSPGDPQPVSNAQPTNFADGGSLENSGINGLLAYSDVENVISFINTMQPLVVGKHSAHDQNGNPIPNTNYIVDDTIPPLFGYRPYEHGSALDCYKGYVLYSTTNFPDYELFQHNQIFDSKYFPAFLQGLAKAAGTGLNSGSAILSQTLPVMANPWFGIDNNQGQRTITVVWCYLNNVTAWDDLFTEESVKDFLKSQIHHNHFPNFSTLETHLTAAQINLLSGLTSWIVRTAEATNGTFSSLFKSAAARAVA